MDISLSFIRQNSEGNEIVQIDVREHCLFLVLIGVDWIHLDNAVWWADRMMIR